MSKLNNKGFAISTIMYMILVVVVILLTLSLSILSSRRLILDGIKKETTKVIYEENSIQQDSIYRDNSGANVPDLMNNALTPVIYDGNNWKIADKSQEWYDYNNQWWANAVILRSTVQKSVGEVITVDGDNPDVVAMLVWIPRYSYTISDTAKGEVKLDPQGNIYGYPNPGLIDIKFVGKNIIETGTAMYTGDSASNWYTHPAFNFGGEQLSGIWVGKFETTGTETSPTILPNFQSLENQVVSEQFETAKRFNATLGNYGNSHMAKNIEWGAVAYLSQSIYGKYGNDEYENLNKEVYANNSEGYYTGRSGGAPGGNTPTIKELYPDYSGYDVPYFEYGYYTYDGYKVNYDGSISTDRELEKGIGASTTGNIYGVYDMSGGTWERVMGYYTAANLGTELPWGSTSSSDYAKFKNEPELKYYDVYVDDDSFNETYKGQALGETLGWYMDNFDVVGPSVPWSSRGGGYDSRELSGIFYYLYDTGIGDIGTSFRTIFAPTS